EALRDIIGKPRIPLCGLARAIDFARRRQAMVVGPALLTILSWQAASDQRRRLAIEGLGALGDAHAVPLLKKTAEDDAVLASAVRSSIAQIQARCKIATGALSLVKAEEGQLAIVGHAIPHGVRR
ncbi:MAG: hypothetical protein AAF449_21970, partial [Myxococcota bacterium]